MPTRDGSSSILAPSRAATSSRQSTAERRGLSKLLERRTSSLPLTWSDANVGYITLNSSNRPIYKTTNGGTTWTPVTTPFTGQIRAVRAVDANLVYLGIGSGTNRVGKSIDGGATWQQIALPATADVVSLDFIDANTGYVAGQSQNALFKTTDGGATWSFQNAHVNAVVRIYAGPSGAAWALGTSASILRSAPLQPTSAVSRLTHGGAGTFDIDLPLTGTTGVECRNAPAATTRSLLPLVTRW